MTIQCKTCKFWSKHENNNLGSCLRWIYGYDVAIENIPLNEVLVEYNEGWGAQTGPNFGCVLWISK